MVTDTSTESRLSAAWVGYAGAPLKASMSTAFGVNDTYFTTTVTLQNVGSSTLYNVNWMRNVDPDQEEVRVAVPWGKGCVFLVCPHTLSLPHRSPLFPCAAVVWFLRHQQLRKVPACAGGRARPVQPSGTEHVLSHRHWDDLHFAHTRAGHGAP